MKYKNPGKDTYRYIATLALAARAIFSWMPITACAALGDLDLTFGTGGRLPPPDNTNSQSVASSIAVQPDQKILVLEPWSLRRFLPNGSLDGSFGSDGSVDIPGSYPVAHWTGFETDIALQGDGKIIVTGPLD